jgi:hypothetical protein
MHQLHPHPKPTHTHIHTYTPPHREETKVLMKELLKQQISWREDLQACGVHVGVPSFQPPRGLTVVSGSSSSRNSNRVLTGSHVDRKSC